MADQSEQTEQEKYFRIYREYTFKAGAKWARKLGSYEKRRNDPYGVVSREVNGQMRRFLGAEKFAKFSDLLEYLMIKEGILYKDGNNRLDATPKAFQMWLE